MKEAMTLARLAGLIDQCFDYGITGAFQMTSREPKWTWEEVHSKGVDKFMNSLNEILREIYEMALQDVRRAIDGDPSGLEEFFSDLGKIVPIDPYWVESTVDSIRSAGQEKNVPSSES